MFGFEFAPVVQIHVLDSNLLISLQANAMKHYPSVPSHTLQALQGQIRTIVSKLPEDLQSCLKPTFIQQKFPSWLPALCAVSVVYMVCVLWYVVFYLLFLWQCKKSEIARIQEDAGGQLGLVSEPDPLQSGYETDRLHCKIIIIAV